MAEKSFLNGRVVIKTGDLTKENTEAIVNAANSSLMGGGGVDGAIHQAGGSSILEECRKIRNTTHKGGLPEGEAVLTTAGNMPSKYVIHTVGPRWSGGSQNEPHLLKNCYLNSLKLANKIKIKSIAFPAISTGIFGYPSDQAARISSETVLKFLSEFDLPQKVVFIFFSPTDYEIFLKNSTFK